MKRIRDRTTIKEKQASAEIKTIFYLIFLVQWSKKLIPCNLQCIWDVLSGTWNSLSNGLLKEDKTPLSFIAKELFNYTLKDSVILI